ncbi:ribose-phosphate pyrophosphokinase [Allosphingosinicella flava]|uniref:Ribose-phosphate pyrophosphokinase n=1 Tax=Allosphingosinicella flava TaxID=2771430 RepID=A0A7T2GJ76_9SPHN|nr:ribose-phosphate pyrophosphokinase [Sphingosinicella flava]QPQ54855.1 ribose-phosphate pyrophosphokinase [Sphingosinicella flava]
MGEPLADWREVRAHLIGAARAETALTYAELLERLGYGFSRPKMRQLCAVLGTVDEDAESRGEPELAVLVVRQSDGLPGQGWWVAGGGRSRGYNGPWEGPEAARFIASVQAKTFAYWRAR